MIFLQGRGRERERRSGKGERKEMDRREIERVVERVRRSKRKKET